MDLTKKFWHWTLLIFLGFLWGTSPILVKKALESYTPGQVAAIRIFTAFIFSIPILIGHIKQLKKSNVKSIIIVGYLGTGVPAFLFATAQTQITSSLAGMLNSLVPLFALLIGLIIYKNHAKWINILGVVLGLIGAAILIITNGKDIFSGNNWYGLLVVAATICYAISANEVRNFLTGFSGTTVAVLGFMFVGPVAGIYLLFSDFAPTLSTPNYIENLIYIIILAIFCSVLAVIGHTSLIKHTSTLFATSTSYIIPIFAILWGVIDGENITYIQLICISVVLFGVYVVNRK